MKIFVFEFRSIMTLSGLHASCHIFDFDIKSLARHYVSFTRCSPSFGRHSLSNQDSYPVFTLFTSNTPFMASIFLMILFRCSTSLMSIVKLRVACLSSPVIASA